MNYFSTSPPHWLKYDTQKTPFVLPYSVVLPAQNPKPKRNTAYCANHALKLKVQQNGDSESVSDKVFSLVFRPCQFLPKPTI